MSKIKESTKVLVAGVLILLCIGAAECFFTTSHIPEPVARWAKPWVYGFMLAIGIVFLSLYGTVRTWEYMRKVI
jgi:xanthine/uracil permease